MELRLNQTVCMDFRNILVRFAEFEVVRFWCRRSGKDMSLFLYFLLPREESKLLQLFEQCCYRFTTHRVISEYESCVDFLTILEAS